MAMRTTLLVILILYIGIQSVMAFCPAQFSVEGEIVQFSNLDDCDPDNVVHHEPTWLQQAGQLDSHCLDSQDPANSPLKSHSENTPKNSGFATDYSVDLSKVSSFSQFVSLLNIPPGFEISTSLLSQKTSLLFYH